MSQIEHVATTARRSMVSAVARPKGVLDYKTQHGDPRSKPRYCQTRRLCDNIDHFPFRTQKYNSLHGSSGSHGDRTPKGPCHISNMWSQPPERARCPLYRAVGGSFRTRYNKPEHRSSTSHGDRTPCHRSNTSYARLNKAVAAKTTMRKVGAIPTAAEVGTPGGGGANVGAEVGDASSWSWSSWSW